MKVVAHWPKHFFLISGKSITEKSTDRRSASHHHADDAPSRESMGGKAYNLQRMMAIGLPVPPALVIGTHYTNTPEACLQPLQTTALPALEAAAGMKFGDGRKPLIVSVRSGAPISMPGMMETLLNVGLCDETLPGLLRQTGNPRLVWDAYRRLIAGYGEIVCGLPGALFEDAIAQATQGRDERLLDFSELRELTRQFQSIYAEHAGQPFPQDVSVQLNGAIRAVFASWQADKAQEYRKFNHIDDAIGTAVTIQCMVFGNAGGDSGAGVGFTRNPTNGEPQLWVDFLANAQGEDVVSGRRNAHGHEALESIAPEAWRQLQESTQALEREFADMQDFEFTVQDGVLHLLQTRTGKRAPLATARIALDLLDENSIDAATALERTAILTEPDLCTVQLAAHDALASKNPPEILGRAMPASPGIVSGEIALDGERAAARIKAGVRIILVRQDAETSDITALESAVGLLTQRGARTAHAAVVARQLGKVCLVGCENLQIDAAARTLCWRSENGSSETNLREGDVITLDGNDGAIYAGELAVIAVPDTVLIGRLRALRSSAHHTQSNKPPNPQPNTHHGH